MTSKLFVLSAAVLLAAACAPETSTTPNPALGESVRHNMAIHVMPPATGAPLGTPLEIPGPRADVAIDRYMKGKVKPLRTDQDDTSGIVLGK